MFNYPPVLYVIEDLVGHELKVVANSEPDSPAWITGREQDSQLEPTISGMVCPLKKHSTDYSPENPAYENVGGVNFVWRIYTLSNIFWCSHCDYEGSDYFYLGPADLYKFIKGNQPDSQVEDYFRERWHVSKPNTQEHDEKNR